MRRADRAVTAPEEIREILDSCKVCRLAMVDEGTPYLVPLNFGYQWEEQLTLCFHSALEGRKISALRRNPQVCFEMDCAHALVSADTACGHSYRYASIIGEGEVIFLTDPAPKRTALETLMKHQTGQTGFSFAPEMLEKVAVFQVKVSRFTAKRRT